MPLLSVGIMHVPTLPDRREVVRGILESLPKDMACKLSEDPDRLGPWPTAKRAWEFALEAGADYHLVLQDDIRLCRDFWEALPTLIASRPDHVISLFAARRKAFDTDTIRWGLSEGPWGPGVIMPTPVVREFLQWEADNIRPEFKHDDTRISLFCRATKRVAWIPFPNWVDHLPLKSALNHNKPRVTPFFLEGSALAYDWAFSGVVMESLNSMNHPGAFL